MKVAWFATAMLAAFVNGVVLEAEFGALGGMGGMVDPMIAAQVSALQNAPDMDQIKQAGREAKAAVQMQESKQMGYGPYEVS